ncbi:hypothetical protein K457DRAFT_16746 [Linnemannia elongata AG-77]|uniref:WAP domain-containing protein n=1 Tax=Linnemannia elongata AG-77 TaxID=1314771 RepID=A0A197K2Y7_9FUNG|nr:hypothetical protein K457DRAFT_16746 [Linnemannia elongata AG-77]
MTTTIVLAPYVITSNCTEALLAVGVATAAKPQYREPWPQPQTPTPKIPLCPGTRTCVWYHDECASSSDCKILGQTCCLFPGCGQTCI